MKIHVPVTALLLLVHFSVNAQSRYRLTGYVRAAQTDQPIAGAAVRLPDVGLGTVTDSAGFFTLPLPKGLQTVQVSHAGFETLQRTSTARADEAVTYRLVERITLLNEAIVMAGGPGQNVRSAAGGITSLSIRTLKQLPTLLGEVDVLRTVQFLPGVSNVGEVFDATPATLRGNIRNVNADGPPMPGYFQVSARRQRIVYVSRLSTPGQPFAKTAYPPWPTCEPCVESLFRTAIRPEGWQ